MIPDDESREREREGLLDDWEEMAKWARRAKERDIAARFDALCETVESVPDELLDDYGMVFIDEMDSAVNDHLKQLIRDGSWIPATATEFVERFVAEETESYAQELADPEIDPTYITAEVIDHLREPRRKAILDRATELRKRA